MVNWLDLIWFENKGSGKFIVFQDGTVVLGFCGSFDLLRRKRDEWAGAATKMALIGAGTLFATGEIESWEARELNFETPDENRLAIAKFIAEHGRLIRELYLES